MGVVGVAGAVRGEVGSRISVWSKTRANLTGLTPERVSQLVRLAEWSSWEQSRLFDTIISRDSEVSGALQQRLMALMGGKWEFVEGENTERKRRPLKKLLTVLKKVKGLKKAIRHLGLGAPYGYAAVEIVYKLDGSGEPERLKPVPFGALDCRQGTIWINLGSKWYDLENDANLANRFLIIKYDENDPAGAALMRAVVTPWVTKFYALQDWAIYSEKLGNPPIIATYKPGQVPDVGPDRPADLVIAEKLDDIKGHSSAAVPEGTEIEMLADARLDASKSFYLLIDTCDRWIKRAILTSESTMQSGAEGQGARAADQVRAEYGIESVIQADGELILDVLQEQLVDRVAGFLGYEPGVVMASVNWKRELPTMQQVQAACQLKQAGFTFEEEPILAELGYTYRKPDPIELAPKPLPGQEQDQPPKPEKKEPKKNG